MLRHARTLVPRSLRVAGAAHTTASRTFSTATVHQSHVLNPSAVAIAAGAAGLAGSFYLQQNQREGPVRNATAAANTPVEKNGTTVGNVDYQQVYNDIASILDEKWDDGSYGPVLIRLAWHASGTYCQFSHTGGSNSSTIRFAPESEWGANAGLVHARKLLEQVKAKHPGITYADLYTLGGVVAVQEMSSPGVPDVPMRPTAHTVLLVADCPMPQRAVTICDASSTAWGLGIGRLSRCRGLMLLEGVTPIVRDTLALGRSVPSRLVTNTSNSC
eukprot:GDKI01016007.1.p1 GENE.GDKI01016007.1~~GDKI01016007.1.p1  ORF type:complete len:293 (+),score=30.13 GDKI01016007.1:62-880(+)